jgi:enhancing lycopene biosynthesis protein 2
MARVGVVLSGCGVYDGAEIHEAVFTMLALDEAGAEVVFLAPDVEQMHVVDHARGERRNVLAESARIARGKVVELSQAGELDALVFPGGFGVAKNLCDFAVNGADCAVNPAVARLVLETKRAGKPIGFACIAPAMAAAIFRDAGVRGVKLTVGSADDDAAAAITAMGAEHVARPVDEIVVDGEHRVVSTPAYMYGDARPHLVRAGLKKMVDAVLSMT